MVEPSEVRARAKEEEEGVWALLESVEGEAAWSVVTGSVVLVLRRKGLWEPKLEGDSEAMLAALFMVVVLVLKLVESAGT